MIGDDGENLVILLSQPRAGSTLLQKVISSHSNVQTTSEPWVLLLPLGAFREDLVCGSFDMGIWRRAVDASLAEAGNTRKSYYDAVGAMASEYYSSLMDSSECTLFLDKTPRYSWVIDELQEALPAAKFVLLLRHPLAVLSSILTTFMRHKEYGLGSWGQDLKTPAKFGDVIESQPSNLYQIRFEEFLASPESELEALGAYLEIDFSGDELQYGASNRKSWRFGDPASVDERNAPDAAKATSWESRLEDAQIWKLCRGYLDFLGEDVFESLGYSYEDSLKTLESTEPSRIPKLLTSSFQSATKKTTEARSSLTKAAWMLRNGIRSGELADAFREIWTTGIRRI